MHALGPHHWFFQLKFVKLFFYAYIYYLQSKTLKKLQEEWGWGGGRFASHTHEVLHESLTYMIHPPPHWLSPHLLGKEVSYIGISMMETVPKLLNDTNICFRLSLYKKPSYLYREHTQSTSSQKKKDVECNIRIKTVVTSTRMGTT